MTFCVKASAISERQTREWTANDVIAERVAQRWHPGSLIAYIGEPSSP
jgi:hypothetical protein